MIIASWNVNSVRLRVPHLLEWLKSRAPDVVCLQELKCQREQFPFEEIESAGYHVTMQGQKGFNGVAILSRQTPQEVVIGLAGDENDEQARYIEVLVPWEQKMLRICGLYLPNGNPVESEKYPYKLAFMERLKARAKVHLDNEEAFIMAGDYNVIPRPQDCYSPEAWKHDALFLPQTRASFQELKALGLTDAIETTHNGEKNYTFWDYQAGSWPKNNGIRIDHLLLSPQAADCLLEAGIDKHLRDLEKPSDHVPVWCGLRSA
jgi:exodeoxyribonuclease III